MILPNKYLLLNESLIGLSAFILNIIKNKQMGIEEIWEKFEKEYVENSLKNSSPTYQKFLYTLDFMFLSKMINYTLEGEIYNENIKS